MKLKQFISSTNTPAKVNQQLSQTFGFNIKGSASSQQLENLIEECTQKLVDLRQNNKNATTAEYAEQLLIKEAAQKLLKQRIIVEGMVGPGGDVYRRVLGWLTDYACRSINVGDSFDVAIKNALREYRSSPYRFPEIEVEHDLRKAVKACYSDELAEPLALEDYQAHSVEEKTHPNSKIYDKCWPGYRKVPGKKRGEPGSCRKETPAERALRTSEGVAEDNNHSIEIDEAIKVGTRVKMHAPGKDYHRKVGHVREIRHGLYKGAPKTYTVEYDPDKETGMYSQSIQLPKGNIKVYKESVEEAAPLVGAAVKAAAAAAAAGAALANRAMNKMSEDDPKLHSSRVEYDLDDQDNTVLESPVFSSIAYRISMQRLDLIRDYGIEKVMDAIQTVANNVGDLEEIGSSDISVWVNEVEQELAGNVSEQKAKWGGPLRLGPRSGRDREYDLAARYQPPEPGEPGYEEHLRVENRHAARTLAHRAIKHLEAKLDPEQKSIKRRELTKKFFDLLQRGVEFSTIDAKIKKSLFEQPLSMKKWMDANREGYKLKYPKDWKEQLEADAKRYADKVKGMYPSKQQG